MRQEEILSGLREFGPCTARELVIYLCGDRYPRAQYINTHTKIWTLYRQGYVLIVDYKKGRSGGSIAPVWKVVA